MLLLCCLATPCAKSGRTPIVQVEESQKASVVRKGDIRVQLVTGGSVGEGDILNVKTGGSVRLAVNSNATRWQCDGPTKAGPDLVIRVAQDLTEASLTSLNCKLLDRFAKSLPPGKRSLEDVDDPAELKRLYDPATIKPDDSFALTTQGFILERTGDYVGACKAYTGALKLAKGSAWIQRKADRVCGLPAQFAARADGRGERQWALVVGISRYLWFPSEWDIPGAEADADWFTQFIRSKGNRELGADVTALLGESATLAGIRRSIRDILRGKARSGDTVWIYLAAHAVQVRRAGDVFLAAYDSRLDEAGTLFPLWELQDAIEDASRAGVKVRVFADICHAAAALERLERSRGRIVPGRLDPATLKGAEVWGLLASGANQFSTEVDTDANSGHIPPHKHGLFSLYLLKELETGKRPLSSTALRNYVSQQMQERPEGKRQQPVEFPDKKGQLELVQGPAADRIDHRYQQTTKGVHRISSDEAHRRWDELRAENQASCSNQCQIFAQSLEDEGNLILDEYLSGGEIPQTEEDFRRGADLFALLEQIPNRQGMRLIQARLCFFRGMTALLSSDATNYVQAIGHFEKALDRDDDAGYVHNALAQAILGHALEATDPEIHDKELQRARDEFRTAMWLDPEWAYPRHNLAFLAETQAEDEEAARLYQEAIQRSVALGIPSGSSYHNYGNLLQARGQTDEARLAYRKAVELFGARVQQYEALNKSCRSENSSSNSCETYGKLAAAFQRSEAVTWNALGVLEMTAHHSKDALDDFTRAATADPLSVAAIYNRYVLSAGKLPRSEIERQRDALKSALESQTGAPSPPGIFLLATLEATLDPRSSEAETGFARVAETNGAIVEPWLGLLRVLVARGELSRAEAVLAKALAQIRDDKQSQRLRNEFERMVPPR